PQFIIGWIDNLHDSNFAARTEQWAKACPAIGRSIKLSLPAFPARNPPQCVMWECSLYGALLWICSQDDKFTAAAESWTTVNHALRRKINKAAPDDTPKNIGGNFASTRL